MAETDGPKGITVADKHIRPRPANLNVSSNMADCFEEIRRNFEAHLHVYLIPSARPYFIECLVQHLSSKYSLSETEKEEIHNMTLSKILPDWTPIIEALDKGNMIIENAFDTEKCMSLEKIRPLLDRAKQFATKRLLPNGNGNIQAKFEKCWRFVEDSVYERNNRVSGHEEALRNHAVELVQTFYREQLTVIMKPPSDTGDLIEEELESTAIKTLHTLYEFGKEAENWTNLLKEQLASVRETVPKPQPPTVSVVVTDAEPEVEQENQTFSSAPSRKEASDCSAITLSKIQDPELTKTDSGQPSISMSDQVTTEEQLTLVIHIPRGTETPVRVGLVGETSTTSVVEFPKFMAIDGGIVLIGEEARQCDQHMDMSEIVPGSETVARFINGAIIKLRYEEVFGLFLVRCRQIVGAQVNSVASKCVIVIPIMTTCFERQAIRDAAICSGWSMEALQLVSEPAAVAFIYFKFMHSPGKNENVIVLQSSREGKKDLQEEFVLFTLSSAYTPHVRMESVTGHLLLPYFTKWRYTLLSNHEKYWRDTSMLIGHRLQVSEIVYVRGNGKQKLEGARFKLIPTHTWNDNKIIEGAMVLAGVTRAALETNSGQSLMSECFQYEIKCRIVAFEPMTLFFRGSNNKARETQQQLRVRSAREEIQFEVWNSINDKCIAHCAQFSVRSKTGKKIDSPYIQFKVDSSGILTVKPASLDTDLLVTRLDTYNLRNEKELATSRATVCRLMTPGYGDQF